jgi:carboxyl-terminal processing protease
MKDIYLWNTSIPSVNYTDYDTPEKFMEALRYKPLDKWSVVLTKTEFNQYFEEGQMIGHGISLSADGSGVIRVIFVYRSAQAFLKGVRRGWIIKRVNGSDATWDNIFTLLGKQETGIKNDIEFLNENNETIAISLIKEEIDLTPVLYRDTVNWGNKTIGYMVFQDFIEAAKVELDETFSFFNTAGIQELIVDLRYNGGGSVEVAEYLAGWLIGKNYSGNSLVKFIHNQNNSEYDTTIHIPPNANGLRLDRIFFIGTRETASASELIINGVKPYLKAILGGSYTHGKPVSMYAIPLKNYEYVILPVSFKYTNAADSGDFYNGLPPDFLAPDDITKDFGDPEEDCLESILNYIATGNAYYTSGKTTGSVHYLLRKEPICEFLKAF